MPFSPPVSARSSRGRAGNPWKYSLLFLVSFLLISSARGQFIGWACGGGDGNGGVLLCTTNGTDWFRQGVGQIGTVPVSGVAAVNGRYVWVVGDPEDGYASVYYSPNAGRNWQRQGDDSSLPDVSLHKIWAVDRNVLWAIGVEGAVVVTRDGGLNWYDVSVPGFSNMLQGITAVNEDIAWVSGERNPAVGMSAMFYTDDGGASWTPQTSDAITNSDHLLGLDALDENRVWAIGQCEVILVTTNAGAEWDLLYKGVQKDGNEICVLDDRRIWAANDSHVTWTTNGGIDWGSHNTADYTMDVSTPDGTNVWAVASGYYGGIVYHSRDGGATWTNQAESNAWTGLFMVEVQNKPEQRTFYVDANSGSAESPFGSWETAASNIQDAVDAASDGDRVLVTNGVYTRGGAASPIGRITNRIMADKSIAVMSVNGPEVTIIEGDGPDGDNAVRGAYLAKGAQLSGFTIVNGHVWDSSHDMSYDLYGGGVFQNGPSLVSNCVLTGNTGSGAFLMYADDVPVLGPPRLVYSLVNNNQGLTGGGIRLEDVGEVRNCRVMDNRADGAGGGVSMTAFAAGCTTVLHNCFIAGNRVLNEQGDSGGGVSADGLVSIRYCTIVNNIATEEGGGLWALGDWDNGDPELVNTILSGNTAPTNENVVVTNAHVRNCCSTPLLEGVDNMDADPLMLGIRNPHIAESSSCRTAGITNGVTATDTDIDGESRVVGGQTDIGCDQYIGANIDGALAADILVPHTEVLTEIPLALSADVEGKAFWQRWLIETNDGLRTVSNSMQVTQTWPVQGVYTVRLEAVNLTETVCATQVITVSETAVLYASPYGGNLEPYTNWAMAATSLCVAVASCPAGGLVYVGTGTYVEAEMVSVTKPLSILGVGEPDGIRVNGQDSFPCFHVSHPSAVLSNLTLVNGFSSDQGGGAYLRDGLITHCLVVSNYAFSQGGGLMCWGDARVEWCLIEANEAGKWGGGIMANDGGAIRNCRIRNNNAHNYGGGADISESVRLENSFVTGNRAFGGAGVHLDGGGIAQNCTIIYNKAIDNGGGVLHRFADTGATCNCIVYHNEAPVGPNINFQVSMTGTVEYTCSWPMFLGAGNVTNDPVLLGFDNPHIVFASPCHDGGSGDYLPGLQRDIDDEDRLFAGVVDIGCDEFVETNILGALSAAIRGDVQVVADQEAELFPDIEGKAWAYHWQVDEGGGVTNIYNNIFRLTHTWTEAGYYNVELLAWNDGNQNSITVRVHVIEGGFTNYVSPHGAHVYPFTNWADAATNVQSAIDACWVGGVVMVETGTYAEGRTIELKKPVSVIGVGGPEACVFSGEMSYRVIDIDHECAVLSGIGVENGMDADAAGVYMLKGTVSNCIIAANVNTVVGGGIRCAGQSLLTDSVIAGNTSTNWPGGVFCSGWSVVRNCTIEGNFARNNGGGVYIDQSGLVSGCVIRANSAATGGGVYLHYAGIITDSIIHSNVAANGAGGFLYWGGTITNCDITWNWGQFDGGGLWFNSDGLVTDSRVQQNFADINAGSGGGAVLSGGGVMRRCDISSNLAAFGAGLYSQDGGLIDVCHIHHNISPVGWGDGMGAGAKLASSDTMRDCLIDYNMASNMIGGVLILEEGLVQNCTIAHNVAGDRVGGVAIGQGSEVYNSIFHHNEAPLLANWDTDTRITVGHCCTTPDSPDFTDSIIADPVFMSGTDCRLQTNSPCVNAGLNDYWMAGAVDLDGNTRIRNGAVDVGAYESAWWGMFADVDEDGFVDWTEVNITGTDPTNAQSFLGMRGFGVQGAGDPGVVVQWQSVAGKLYNVDRATNLVDAPAFTNWMSGVTGLPDVTTVTDTTATAEGPYFYRVEIGP